MNNDANNDLSSVLQSLQAQMANLAQQQQQSRANDSSIVQALQAQVAALTRQQQHIQADTDSGTGAMQLSETVAGCIPPHLQIKPLDAAERKRVVNGYAKLEPFPKVLRDSNGLAAKAIPDAKERKWLLTHAPTFQKDALDVLRVGAFAWQRAIAIDEPAARADYLLDVLKDVVVLAADNAQRAAQLQCEGVFEAAGAKGAYSFLKLGPNQNEIEIDQSDHSVVQQVHIEAMQDLRKFSKEITPTKHIQAGKGRGHYQRQGNRGYNNYRGGRGYGGGRGGRGGRGSSYMGRGGGWRSNNSGSSGPNDQAADP